MKQFRFYCAVQFFFALNVSSSINAVLEDREIFIWTFYLDLKFHIENLDSSLIQQSFLLNLLFQHVNRKSAEIIVTVFPPIILDILIKKLVTTEFNRRLE